MKRYYLDNCATTPMAPEIAGAITDFMGRFYGNPSSIHHEGRLAAHALAEARRTIAESIGAKPAEIVFTGSGTEANNLAIAGTISRPIRQHGRAQVITSTTEHSGVRTRLEWEKRIYGDALEVMQIPVDETGLLHLDELDAHLSSETTLVAFLLVNNETGVVQNIDELKKRKLAFPTVPWLLDVVQGHTKVQMDMRLWPFDLLSFAAHKIYGPKGTGALYVRGGVELDPMIVGGSQEKYRRAGTENMIGAVGFAAAVDLAPPPAAYCEHLAALEKAFLEELSQRVPDYQINGGVPQAELSGRSRLPGFLNLSFPGIASREDLQIALDLEGVSLSSTSACHSGVVAESHVLEAMGISGERRSGAIRLLFSRYQTEEDVRQCAGIIGRVVNRIRAESGVSA